MAAIVPSNVVVHDTYEVGSRSGKFRAQAVLATITLAAQGGTAGDIPATVFGLSQITHVDSVAAVIGGQPRPVPMNIANFNQPGNYIFPLDLTQATDASRTTPANITGTVTVYLEGIPSKF